MFVIFEFYELNLEYIITLKNKTFFQKQLKDFIIIYRIITCSILLLINL